MNFGIDLILNDADALVYGAGYAAQKGCKGDEVKDVPFSHAVNCLRKMMVAQHLSLGKALKQIYKDEDGDTVVKPGWAQEWEEEGKFKTYLGSQDRSNFRYSIAKILPYKGQRTGDRPYHFDRLRDHLFKEWNAEEVYGMEADDKISIEAAKHPGKTLINHMDKDLWQIPNAWHAWHDGSSIYNRRMLYVDNPGFISLERTNSGTLQVFATGQYMIAYQLLAGDTSDNIPSVAKGFGPAQIYELLKDHRTEAELFAAVKNKYYEVHGVKGQDRYEEIKRLVTLLTKEID